MINIFYLTNKKSPKNKIKAGKAILMHGTEYLFDQKMSLISDFPFLILYIHGGQNEILSESNLYPAIMTAHLGSNYLIVFWVFIYSFLS